MKLKITMHYFKNLYIFFSILAVIIFFFSPTKVKANAFEVNNIEISKPFKIGFNKNRIIDIGFKKAFFELLNSLIRSSDLEITNNIKLSEIKGMIQSFSIQEEKFINEIYYVNIGVSFDRIKVFNYLEKKNIFPAQPIKEAFLFIPIIIDENNNDIAVFSNNKIYNDWNKSKKEYQLINYVLATEDLEDLNIIKSKYDFIENYNFKEITDKYFLKNSIVALIFKDNQDVRILSRMTINKKVFIKNKSLLSLDLNNENQILPLIEELKITYEDLWKEYNQINTSIKLPLMIRIDNNDSEKLLMFEATLEKMYLVNNYFIQKFNKNYIYYKIIFNGTPKTFIETMNKKKYKIDTQKKIWILK